MKTQATSQESPQRIICRRKRAAEELDVCESQLLKFETKKLLTPIKVDGIRAVWYDADQVRRLAENIRRGRLSSEATS